MAEYRIRWARVLVTDMRRDRLCLAERKGKFGIWWPVGDWSPSDHMAQLAIDNDIELRQPLPATTFQ